MRGQGPASVIFSIDFAGRSESGKAVSSRGPLDLHRTFQRYHIPATWALAQWNEQGLASQLVAQSSAARTEIALLGDRSWIGREHGRTRFARQLIQHLEAARGLDIKISTLALRNVRLEDHLDLLVKHKINVVRGDVTEGDTGEPQVKPLSLRYGIWQAPAACSIADSGAWWPRLLMNPARRAVRRAIAAGTIAHFRIEYDRIERDLPRQMQAIEYVLKFVAQRQQQGLVRVLTLQQMAAQLSPVRTAPAARSLLRAA